MEINLGGRFGSYSIGDTSPTFIIAEIGSNHNQNLQLAYDTIDAAVDAGADAVKFQSINVDKLYHRPSPEVIELHKRIDLPEDWHYKLNDYCQKAGIIFFSSPTYLEAIPILESIEVPIYKLASAQIGTFPQLVKEVATLQKPTIISTGIVSYSDLEKAVKIFHEVNNMKYIILHCNSQYPTPPEKVHLPLMDVYKEMFDCIIGFSDHTLGIHAPIAAVARGAKVIEKHFTLDRNLPVPDAAFSLNPKELKEMIRCVREIEKMMEKSIRLNIEQNEQSFKSKIQTSLILKESKKPGQKMRLNDFDFRRSEQGINCTDLNGYVERGFEYKKYIPENTLIGKGDIGL